MAYTRKSKRIAYDNIASGSVTGAENIIAVGGSFDTTELSPDQPFTSRQIPERHNAQSTSTTSFTSKFLENPSVDASTS